MHVARASLLVAALLSLTLLAGCSDSGGSKDLNQVTDALLEEEASQIDATATTGGIRGIVVDEAIRPISDVAIEISGQDGTESTKTGASGVFVFSGLQPGSYLVKAAHPLYSQAQQTADVVAGEKEPPAVKIQLVRTIFAEPYVEHLKFDGFIVCSVNIILVAYSEECGEGVGSPEDSCFLITHPPQCVDNPIMPGQRIGGQAGNNPQFDYLLHPGFATSVIEIVWKPTSEAGTAFFAPVSTDWLCDPFCGGNRIFSFSGGSPLYGRFEADIEQLAPEEFVFDQDYVTVFTWAEMNEENPAASALLNQQYQEYVTNFYYVPAPEGWSFVNGDKDPF